MIEAKYENTDNIFCEATLYSNNSIFESKLSKLIPKKKIYENLKIILNMKHKHYNLNILGN